MRCGQLGTCKPNDQNVPLKTGHRNQGLRFAAPGVRETVTQASSVPFEPQRSTGDSAIVAPDPVNTARFAILQKYNRVNLLVPLVPRPCGTRQWRARLVDLRCLATTIADWSRPGRSNGGHQRVDR
jgi:hypothetical protein